MKTLILPHDDTEVMVAITKTTRAQLRWLALAQGCTMKSLAARLIAAEYQRYPALPQPAPVETPTHTEEV